MAKNRSTRPPASPAPSTQAVPEPALPGSGSAPAGTAGLAPGSVPVGSPAPGEPGFPDEATLRAMLEMPVPPAPFGEPGNLSPPRTFAGLTYTPTGPYTYKVTEDEPAGTERDDDDTHEAVVWRRNPEFPNYIRRVRERAGLSIRQAAPALGVSVAYLSRLENGGPARSPNMERLYRMADVYGVDRRTMLVNAGVHVEVPPELARYDKLDSQFAAAMLDPTIKPALLTGEALHYMSDRLKMQIIEWADKLTRQPDPHKYLWALLEKGAM